MNMAEIEIAQGNKNLAKQALYNIILNRPVIGGNGLLSRTHLCRRKLIICYKNIRGRAGTQGTHRGRIGGQC